MNGNPESSVSHRQFYSFIYEIFCNKCEFFFSNFRNSKENYTGTVKKIVFWCNRDGLFSTDVVKGIDDRKSGYDDTEERRGLEETAKKLFG